jgi:regulator of replication initiation timing
MTAEAASRAPAISLQELYRLYTSIAAKPGMPVPLTEFRLSQQETERLFSIYDEDYHISRFFHFHHEHGHEYCVNGEMVTHVVIDPEIRLIL